MMRGPKKNALAVRLPDGTIDIELLESRSAKEVFKPCGWPFIRGVVNMVESFVLGYKVLMKSAEKLGLDEEEEKEARRKKQERALKKARKKGVSTEGITAAEANEPSGGESAESAPETEGKKSGNDALFSVLMTFASVLGVGLALVLFMWVPVILFNFLNNRIFEGSELLPYKGMIEGFIKIVFFILYIYAVTKVKDIHRTFQYHGAEHKSIFCYEAGKALTVENVKQFKRFHPRCGTSFLVLVLIVSIIISTVVLFLFPALNSMTWLWIIIKILLIPVICAVGYELIRLCGRHPNAFTRIISAPGMWVQRLTTKEPDDAMIEVAITALKAVIPENPEDDRL